VGKQLPPQSQNRPIELVTVINSFNRRELLERAVTSLMHALREAPFGSAIVVFDAGSNDGSKEFLDAWREQAPGDNLIIVTSPADRASFSDGVNTGCATALTRFPKCRWLFLYETDNWLGRVEPLCQAISLLKAQPKLAAVGFTVKRHSGHFCGYGMRFPSLISFALGQNLSLRWNLQSPNESPWQVTDGIRWRTCDVVFTSPLLIRREVWEATGGFDAECFPFSDSDLDWAWRSAKAGWEMAVIASESVVHDNLEQSSAWSANRLIDFHRSRFRLLRRHRGNRAALIKPVLFLRHCLETVALTCKLRSDATAEAKLTKRRQMLRTVWTDYS
jgi:GT2 family glycosyltransferase